MSNNEIEACQRKYKELEAGKSGIYNTIGRHFILKNIKILRRVNLLTVLIRLTK